jgi:hypothetical protein
MAASDVVVVLVANLLRFVNFEVPKNNGEEFQHNSSSAKLEVMEDENSQSDCAADDKDCNGYAN